MTAVALTNTTEDGQVPGVNPDATTDYFLVSDYNQDKNYFNAKVCEALKFVSANPTNDFQILYGGQVTDSGSGQVDISEGASIGKDINGNFRIVIIPALTNVALPSGWNNDRQIWVIGKHAVKLTGSTRNHFNGTPYQYQVLDSYLGETTPADLFVDSDPGATTVVWGSFKMNGTTFTDMSDRSTSWVINTTDANVKAAIDYSHRRGEIFPLDDLIAENQSFNPLDPESYFPAICLSSIDVQEVLDTSSYPLAFIDNRRAVKLRYLVGESGEVSSWSVTVSGSDITFPNTASANAMLVGLYEDYNVHGATFTNHRTVDVAGVTFAITNINLVTRVVTVSGSPTTGSQTAEFYPYRIAGSTTSIRVFAVKGAGLMAPNDPDGYFIMNLRTRGHYQDHQHAYAAGSQLASISGKPNTLHGTSATGGPDIAGGSDAALTSESYKGTVAGTYSTNIRSTFGTPLTRKITHGPAYTQIFYMWFGG